MSKLINKLPYYEIEDGRVRIHSFDDYSCLVMYFPKYKDKVDNFLSLYGLPRTQGQFSDSNNDIFLYWKRFNLSNRSEQAQFRELLISILE